MPVNEGKALSKNAQVMIRLTCILHYLTDLKRKYIAMDKQVHRRGATSEYDLELDLTKFFR